MFMGESGSGKSELIRILSGRTPCAHKALSVEFCGRFVNTPGEFLENRRFYSALITTSAECDILVLVQDATRRTSMFPPLFATMFNRKVVGVVSRADNANGKASLAERFLANAGVRNILHVDVQSGEGIEDLREVLR